MRRFEPGETVVHRDVFRGKVWTSHAMWNLRDTPEEWVVARAPGAESLAPTTWIQWLLTDDDAVRKQALPNLAAGRWTLDRWVWRDTALLLWHPPGAWFSVNAYYDPADDHRLLRWYVNFQRPLRRTAIGFDTFDLLVDLVVEPDLSGWTWKDEDEYAQGRRLGIIDAADHAAVEAARHEVLAMIARREGPFAPDSPHLTWRPTPDWPPPQLPPEAPRPACR
jgi:hypothetical protein